MNWAKRRSNTRSTDDDSEPTTRAQQLATELSRLRQRGIQYMDDN